MKAVICKKVGGYDGLKLEEVKTPEPGEDEILVGVYASSVNYNTVFFVKGSFMARMSMAVMIKGKGKIFGNDIAGKVISTGKNIRKFKAGDEVYGDLSESGFGAFAEYVCVGENSIAKKPDNISFEEAAAIPEAGLVALQALQYGGDIKGRKVLICGASGGIGTFAVQIAKAYGAEVTGVCGTKNIEKVRSLGADEVIDYTRQDFINMDGKYDFILATAGYRSIFEYKKILKPQGIYISTGGSMRQVFEAILLGPLISGKKGKRFKSFLVKPNKDLDLMRELVEKEMVRPVIDKRYELSEIKDALEYYSKGHSCGKVIVSIKKEI